MLDDYNSFLASKIVRPAPCGFDVRDDWPLLFAWQRKIVRWSLRQGRCAIFAGCGLGKTAMQLAWADAVARHTQRPVLVLAPLAVSPQTVKEGAKFGVKVTLARTQADVPAGASVSVANYQKLLAGHFSPEAFAGVVLDESSILKSYMGKTKQLLVESFAGTPYRLACTATPAPNDHMELGNHSAFLGIMDSDEILSRWFIADQKNCGHYRLKGHAAADFWAWVSSWAVCVDKPSDLGFSDEGFVLPPITYHQHVVGVDLSERKLVDQHNQALLAPIDKLTATGIHKEMRLTADARAAKVAELVNDSEEVWAIWCNTDYEADALKRVLTSRARSDIVEVRGSMKDATKEKALAAFAAGESRVMVTKPSVAGFGLNWQHCHNVAFVGLSYSYEQFYQAVRRTWRFGQKQEVQCHVVIAETEGEVLATIRRKESDSEALRSSLVAATRANMSDAIERRQLTVGKRQTQSSLDGRWTAHLGDSVEVCRGMPDESIDFTIFSPPFSGLYIYSEALADMGNSVSDEEFFRHFGYLVPEMLRLTVPGRLCAVHCKDLPRYAGRDGTAGLKDFPGECIRLFESHGWSYHSRVTVWKCPVVERERTNNNGLLHKTVKRDSSQVRQGMADYLLVFRRPPRAEDGLMSAKPIVRPNGIDRYVGESHNDPNGAVAHPARMARRASTDPALAVWQRYAEPVWWDIDQMDTLNEVAARESQDERHICPLQLGLIRRAVHLWSAPGDLVLSPFAGIGSEGVVSLQEGRRFVGVELKEAYWTKACRYLDGAAAQRELFPVDRAS